MRHTTYTPHQVDTKPQNHTENKNHFSIEFEKNVTFSIQD